MEGGNERLELQQGEGGVGGGLERRDREGGRGREGEGVVEGTYQLLIFGIAEKFLEIGIVVLAAVEAGVVMLMLDKCTIVSGQLSFIEFVVLPAKYPFSPNDLNDPTHILQLVEVTLPFVVRSHNVQDGVCSWIRFPLRQDRVGRVIGG
jgi:hypothetical protein